MKQVIIKEGKRGRLLDLEHTVLIEFEAGLNKKERATVIAHEIGHLILRRTGKSKELNTVQKEREAWKVAYSIIKPELWDKVTVIESMKSYIEANKEV